MIALPLKSTKREKTRGEKIKARRNYLKLSQDAAARNADMPISSWRRIEHDETGDPKISTLRKIAGALGMNAKSLI